ncbi:MAG: hypothetical protein KBA03_06845 [Anaerolineaceae bacterium]|nr:hypothetical protein [Anaerolineaceae bacterium]
MNNTDEKIRILNMVQDGKITAEEAAKLLEALEVKEEKNEVEVLNRFDGGSSSKGKPRWLRIVVTDTNTGKKQVNLKLPVSILKSGMNIASKFNVDNEVLNQIDLDGVLSMADSDNPTGVLVDIEETESGEHVLITVE